MENKDYNTGFVFVGNINKYAETSNMDIEYAESVIAKHLKPFRTADNLTLYKDNEKAFFEAILELLKIRDNKFRVDPVILAIPVKVEAGFAYNIILHANITVGRMTCISSNVECCFKLLRISDVERCVHNTFELEYFLRKLTEEYLEEASSFGDYAKKRTCICDIKVHIQLNPKYKDYAVIERCFEKNLVTELPPCNIYLVTKLKKIVDEE